jgi:uncharacterized protein YtpQ (UPF0354 family)
MWPFRRNIDPLPTTSKAIAYLKAAVRDDDGGPTIELPHDDTPVLKKLNTELLVAYIVDAGRCFKYIQYRDLQTDSVSEAELHDIAIRNLSALADTGKLRVVPYGNIFAVLLDGNFESSMILLDHLWADSFRQFVTGDFLIAIPNRDILAFCDRSSSNGRNELIQVIKRLEGPEDHRLTRTLYVRRGNEWVTEDKP